MVQLKATGLSVADISHHLSRPQSTIYRILALHRRIGSVVTHDFPVGAPRKLTSLDLQFIRDALERNPDMYQDEIQEALRKECDAHVDRSTVARTLTRMGYTRKKVVRPAIERNEAERSTFMLNLLDYPPDYYVVTDESAFSRDTTSRDYVYALRGQRARRREYFIQDSRMSILPAMCLDGIINLSVIEGGHNAESFSLFVDSTLDYMNPYPGPRSVLVMDNCPIHHAEEVEALVDERGMRLLYLPAYSPDLNPIEEAFSCIKAYARRHRDIIRAELLGEHLDCVGILHDVVYNAITPDKIRGWYTHSGYL